MKKSYVFNEKYFRYLNTPDWRAKCAIVRERCNNVCERCHKYQVDEVHHKTYKHIFNEPLEELQGLCAPCHQFVHGNSGIDPLNQSITIKVSSKLIEYWDSSAKKSRRVKIAKLPSENFRWTEIVNANAGMERFSLQQSQLGQFTVPMDVFLDDLGNPVFEPSRWAEFRTASWINGRWYSNRRTGRDLPHVVEHRLEGFKADKVAAEEREEAERRRLQDYPEHFTSYQTNIPNTSKEVVRLFKRYPQIVNRGRECTILNVRETKTLGIVLSLSYSDSNGGWRRWTFPDADKLLAEGRIILDHDREPSSPENPRFLDISLGVSWG